MVDPQGTSAFLEEAFLRLSGDFHTTCVCEGNGPFRIEWVSGRVEEITGYTAQEMLGRGCWLSIVHPEDQDRVEGFLAGLELQRESTVRFRIATKAGEIRWIADTSLVLPHETRPGAYRLISVSRDITEPQEARMREEKNLADLSLVAETAAAINNLDDEAAILRRLGEAASTLVGEGFVLLSTLDPVSKIIRMRGLYGAGPRVTSIAARIMRRDPYEVEVAVEKMNPEDLALFTTGTLHRLPGIYEFTGRTLPRPLCRMIEKALRIRAVWAIGFARQGRHFGGLTVFRRSEEPLPAPGWLETLVRQASVSLDRTRVEEALRTALREKEVLLREVHHRVKNNMQVVSSLINLQARDIPDPRVQAAFREARNRIRTMAFIHEKLYQSGDLARIAMSEYLAGLTGHLQSSIPPRPDRIRLGVAAEGVSLDIGTAIPVGLIVNELVSNALKHAFPEGREGSITVYLADAGSRGYRLSVKDDGVGLPEGVDPDHTETLGLQIVRMLTAQIMGTFRFRPGHGSDFVIEFPRPPEKK